MRRLLLFTPLILAASILSGTSQHLPARDPDPLPLPALAPRLADLLPEDRVAAAAMALRSRDCAAAIGQWNQAAEESPLEVAARRLVEGLQAHACEDVDTARQALTAAWSESPLEDWRLWILADSTVATGDGEAAAATLARLLTDFPRSPLVPRALGRAAALAAEGDDLRRLGELADLGRRRGLEGEHRTALESLVWERIEERSAAGRYLLVREPLVAQELGVAESLRREDGEVQWGLLLSADDLRRRAERLIDLEMASAALSTLEQVADSERDLLWSLTRARALTAARRGVDALAHLEGKASRDASLAAELDWERAMAAFDAATARRGRVNLPSARRGELRELGRSFLRRAAEHPEQSQRALRRLFRELSDPEDFEPALEVLTRLRALDAADSTGARFLWELGWSEFQQRNYSGAVGYWAELGVLYPESRFHRYGRYWTGRAFEGLGQRDRARQIFTEVAATDTTDFYRKFALARLGEGQSEPDPLPPQQAVAPWPRPAGLARAQWLTDLGLDDLAQAELSGVSRDIPEASRKALEAMVLARQGERVESIRRIREAFPALGSPRQAGVPEEALAIYYPVDYEDIIRQHAAAQSLPVHLVLGMIRQESAFALDARSWAGAHGLMQLMPATSREVAGKLGLRWSRSKLIEPAFNVRLGTTYFRQVLEMFDGNVELALAGYNGGPYRIKRLWNRARTSEVDSFLEGLQIDESRIYVKRILLLSDSYQRRLL
ncbi:MAG: transglycosylase SLT domain-containing protein [Acidobacteriota bacterium]